MGDFLGSVGGPTNPKAVPATGKSSGSQGVPGIPSSFKLEPGLEADTVQFGKTLSSDSVAPSKSKGKSVAEIVGDASKDNGRSLHASTVARLKNPPKHEREFAV
jgi:hypothetical protein